MGKRDNAASRLSSLSTCSHELAVSDDSHTELPTVNAAEQWNARWGLNAAMNEKTIDKIEMPGDRNALTSMSQFVRKHPNVQTILFTLPLTNTLMLRILSRVS